jgi:hypothetical protein
VGLYSTVMAELDCQRCGRPYQADVQFYTEDDSGLPVYVEGQAVPALPPGATFEGIADSYCRDCMRRWIQDEKAAHFEQVARGVEGREIGALFARFSFDVHRPDLGRQIEVLRSEPLTPAEIRTLASAPESAGSPNFAARLSQASVILFREGAPVSEPLLFSGGTWWPNHCSRVRQQLSAKGWRSPATEATRDLVVQVDHQSRIGVTRDDPE